MQVRIDSDLRPLVRQHAREQSRSIPAEVNFRLRKAYEPAYTLFGPGVKDLAEEIKAYEADGCIHPATTPLLKIAAKKLKRSIGTSLL